MRVTRGALRNTMGVVMGDIAAGRILVALRNGVDVILSANSLELAAPEEPSSSQ